MTALRGSTAPPLAVSAVLWALCLGAAAWAQQPRFVAAGFYPGSGPILLVQDLDHDGRLDLVTAGIQGISTRIWLGRAGGSFAAGPPVDGGYCVALAVGPANGDTLDDLVCEDEAYEVSVHLSDGLGGYLPRAPLPLAGSGSDVQLRDCNLDGDLDIAEGNGGWFGDGAGQFVPAGGCLPLPGVLAEVTGDGRPDVVRAGDVLALWHLLVWPGLPGGGFGVEMIGPSVPVQSRVAAVGDLNADSLGDAVLASPGQLGLSLGLGGGAFAPPVLQPRPGSVFAAAIGNFGEPVAEAAVLDFTEGKVLLYRSSPGGGLSETFAFSPPGQPYSLGSGDFDLNGVLDLAVFDSVAGGVWIFLARRPVIEIPAVSPIGLALLALLLLTAAFFALRRSRLA